MTTWRKVGCCLIAAGTAYAGQSAASASFVVSARAAADTFTWKACASGDFEDDANWTTLSGNPGHPQLAGDIVVLPKFMSDSSYTVTVRKPFTIGALTVGDTSGVAGACTVTLVFKTTDRVNKVRGDVLDKSGGAIHADSKGYSDGAGRGSGEGVPQHERGGEGRVAARRRVRCDSEVILA